MNKQEAAEFLEVSVRALERYAQQGRISVKYEKGRTRSTANFDQTELAAFKTELNQPTFKPAIEGDRNGLNIETRQKTTDNQSQTSTDLLHSGDIAKFGEIDELNVIDRLAAIIEGLLNRSQNQPIVPVVEKLLLTLPEVQALTGLSKGSLRGYIKDGQLKAKVIGKGWRIKRSDLDDFVADL